MYLKGGHRTSRGVDAMDARDLQAEVDGLMDGLRADLERLAAIPSIAFPGFPAEPVREAHDLLVGLLGEAGVERIERIDLPDTAPVILGEIPPPTPDAPTVLLYSHYDVQPAGDEKLWKSPPFEPTPVEGGLRARGIADDKSNVIAHLGMLRAFKGRPRRRQDRLRGAGGVRQPLRRLPAHRPERFACDAMVIADLGNLRPGTPTLTTGLRGASEVVVEVRTLEEPRHSGEFGGAAPTPCSSCSRPSPPCTTCTETSPSKACAARSGPARATPRTSSAPRRRRGRRAADRQRHPRRAPVERPRDHRHRPRRPRRRTRGVRRGAVRPRQAQPALPPPSGPEGGAGQARRASALLTPFGVRLTVTPGDTGPGYEATTGGPAYRAALTALKEAWGTDASYVATGGSIPLVNGLAKAAPGAEVLLFGAQDSMCNLHAPNERVLFSELRSTVVAMCAFVREYAAGFRAGTASRR